MLNNTQLRTQLAYMFSPEVLQSDTLIKAVKRTTRVLEQGDYKAVLKSFNDGESNAGNPKVIYGFDITLDDGSIVEFEHHQHMSDKDGQPSEIGYQILFKALYSCRLIWEEGVTKTDPTTGITTNVPTLHIHRDMIGADGMPDITKMVGRTFTIGIGVRDNKWTDNQGLERVTPRNFFRGFI